MGMGLSGNGASGNGNQRALNGAWSALSQKDLFSWYLQQGRSRGSRCRQVPAQMWAWRWAAHCRRVGAKRQLWARTTRTSGSGSRRGLGTAARGRSPTAQSRCPPARGITKSRNHDRLRTRPTAGRQKQTGAGAGTKTKGRLGSCPKAVSADAILEAARLGGC